MKNLNVSPSGKQSLDLPSNYRLLGWDDGEHEAIGFRRAFRQEAVTYDGPGHQMTLGITGSGKAVSSAIPELLNFRGNAIVLDIKSELYSVTHRWRRDQLGQQIVVFDPFNMVGGVDRDSFNPFDVAKLLGVSTYEAATAIEGWFTGTTTRTVFSRNSSNDEFWQDKSTDLMIGLTGGAMEGKLPGKQQNICGIRSLLKSDDIDHNIAVMLDKNSPSKPFREEIASYVQTTDVTRSGIHSSLTAHFRGLAGDGVESLLEKTSFDLEGFVQGTHPATIYFLIPIEQLASQQKLVRLVLGSLLTCLYTRRFIPQRKTLVQIDEAAALGQFEPLRTGITLFRGSGIVLHTLFQDIDQVLTLYHDAKTMINNTSVIRLLGASNYWQAAALADLFGVMPKMLMNLEPDEQLLLIDGKARRCRRLNYMRDEFFQGRFDLNPRYLDPHQESPNKHRTNHRKR